MERIAVIGSGLMGHGIAQAFAVQGYPVVVHDTSPAALASVTQRIEANLRALGIPEAAAAAIKLEDSLPAAVSGADFVIETVSENLELKRRIFTELASLTCPDCVLASNTSVIPIGEIASGTGAESRILGMHWWNPPYLIPLVEVVQAAATDPKYIDQSIDLLKRLGKMPVHVRRDVPGFVGNRLLHALYREAISIVEAGICDAATVDLVVKNSFALRLPVLGPLEHVDLVGLDLVLAIQKYVFPDLERSTEPSPLLKQNVEEGRLGMKAGHGFYDWTPQSAQAVHDGLLAHLRAIVDNHRRNPPSRGTLDPSNPRGAPTAKPE